MCSFCGFDDASELPPLAEEPLTDANDPEHPAEEITSPQTASPFPWGAFTFVVVAAIALGAVILAPRVLDQSPATSDNVATIEVDEDPTSSEASPTSVENIDRSDRQPQAPGGFRVRNLRGIHVALFLLAAPLSRIFIKRPETLADRRKKIAKKGW